MIYLELTPDESAAAFVACSLIATTDFKGAARAEKQKMLPKLQAVIAKIEASQKSAGILREASKTVIKEKLDG